MNNEKMYFLVSKKFLTLEQCPDMRSLVRMQDIDSGYKLMSSFKDGDTITKISHAHLANSSNYDSIGNITSVYIQYCQGLGMRDAIIHGENIQQSLEDVVNSKQFVKMDGTILKFPLFIVELSEDQNCQYSLILHKHYTDIDELLTTIDNTLLNDDKRCELVDLLNIERQKQQNHFNAIDPKHVAYCRQHDYDNWGKCFKYGIGMTMRLSCSVDSELDSEFYYDCNYDLQTNERKDE